MMMALPDKFLETSLAPRPEVDHERRQKNEEERQAYQRSRQKFHKETAARNNKLKRQAVMMIMFISLSLFGTMVRSVFVYSAQNEFVALQNQTREVAKSNEALRANLIKASAIGELKEQSIVLNLMENEQGLSLTVDLSVNHFGEEEMVKKPANLIERLFSRVN